MHGLIGDRFLRRFAGSLKHRQKHPAAKTAEEKETEEEKIRGSDSHEPKGACGKEAENCEGQSTDDQTVQQ